jgi:hypothetical protein
VSRHDLADQGSLCGHRARGALSLLQRSVVLCTNTKVELMTRRRPAHDHGNLSDDSSQSFRDPGSPSSSNCPRRERVGDVEDPYASVLVRGQDQLVVTTVQALAFRSVDEVRAVLLGSRPL